MRCLLLAALAGCLLVVASGMPNNSLLRLIEKELKELEKRQDGCEAKNVHDTGYVQGEEHTNEFLEGQLADLLSVCGKRANSNTKRNLHEDFKRIVGGEQSADGLWPWVVSIQKGGHICGGSLITRNWVMTAAHCFQNPDSACDYSVLVGESNVANPSNGAIAVEKILIHPQYDSNEYTYDIALMKLKTPAELGDKTNVVCLPSLHFNKKIPVEKLTNCFVAGWGNTIAQTDGNQGENYPDVYRHISLPILKRSDCNQYNPQLTIGEICAGYKEGGKDSCQGDSGGPLVCQVKELSKQDNSVLTLFYQIGVVSYGNGCAQADYPGVYTNVSHYADWVVSAMKRNTGEQGATEEEEWDNFENLYEFEDEWGTFDWHDADWELGDPTDDFTGTSDDFTDTTDDTDDSWVWMRKKSEAEQQKIIKDLVKQIKEKRQAKAMAEKREKNANTKRELIEVLKMLKNLKK